MISWTLASWSLVMGDIAMDHSDKANAGLDEDYGLSYLIATILLLMNHSAIVNFYLFTLASMQVRKGVRKLLRMNVESTGSA